MHARAHEANATLRAADDSLAAENRALRDAVLRQREAAKSVAAQQAPLSGAVAALRAGAVEGWDKQAGTELGRRLAMAVERTRQPAAPDSARRAGEPPPPADPDTRASPPHLAPGL